MKVKIFKKVVVVFCTAIMTTSVFELSTSAMMSNKVKTDYFVSQCPKEDFKSKPINLINTILDYIDKTDINLNFKTNAKNMLSVFKKQKQDIVICLNECKSVISKNIDIYSNDTIIGFTRVLARLQNIIISYKNDVFQCIDSLHPSVLELCSDLSHLN